MRVSAPIFGELPGAARKENRIMSAGITARDKTAGLRPHWHGLNEIHERITFDNPENNPLLRFDNAPKALSIEMEENGAKVQKETGYSILVSSDDGLPVGVPFNPATYKFNTNKSFVEFVRNSLADVPHKIHSAGTLLNRGRMFISVELLEAPKHRIEGRNFNDYLSYLDAVDKSCTASVVNVSECTECNNMFNMHLATHGYLDARNKHTSGFMPRQGEIAKIISGALRAQEDFYANLAEFKKFPIGLVEAEQIFAGFIGEEGEDISTRSMNQVKRLTELFAKGKGNNGEDLLDVFSAITDFYTHESSAPKALGPDADESPDAALLQRQIESSEMGDGARQKLNFYKLCVKFLENREVFSATVKVGNDLIVSYAKK